MATATRLCGSAGRATNFSPSPKSGPASTNAASRLLIGDAVVTSIEPAKIQIKTAGGALQSFYRRPAVDYALAYRTRIKLLGEDSLKEEPRLRAFEHTVNLCRADTGLDLEAAKAAVLAAIKGEPR